MKYLYLLFFLIIFSCGYPDIDSVPNFKNLVITKEESIDLCKLINTDKMELQKCIEKINIQN